MRPTRGCCRPLCTTRPPRATISRARPPRHCVGRRTRKVYQYCLLVATWLARHRCALPWHFHKGLSAEGSRQEGRPEGRRQHLQFLPEEEGVVPGQSLHCRFDGVEVGPIGRQGVRPVSLQGGRVLVTGLATVSVEVLGRATALALAMFRSGAVDGAERRHRQRRPKGIDQSPHHLLMRPRQRW